MVTLKRGWTDKFCLHVIFFVIFNMSEFLFLPQSKQLDSGLGWEGDPLQWCFKDCLLFSGL